MIFARQWFEPESQVGISVEALTLENLVRCHNYEQAQNLILQQCNARNAGYWHRQYKRIANIKKIQNDNNSERKHSLNVYFSDFWPDFNPADNQLFDLLIHSLRRCGSKKYIRLTKNASDADIAIFSCYGNLASLSKCPQATRILFLGENVRPRYDLFDYSLSFDLNTYGGRNIHCPLWMLEIDWFARTSYPDRRTYPMQLFTSSQYVDYSKRRSSIAFVGNNAEPFRRYLLTVLRNNNIQIDEYGSHTRPVDDKISLLREYKLTICPENSYYPGYVTEKLIHPYLAGCHMIYWGSSEHLGLHDRSYIMNVNTQLCVQQLVSKALSILQCQEKRTFEPLFSSQTLQRYFDVLSLGLIQLLIPYS